MTRLQWRYEDVSYGIEKGVLYPKNSPGVVWDGLTSVDESSEDSDVAVGYFDGQAYYREESAKGFSAKITAFTFPYELNFVDTFGLSYISGTELHLVYNALLATSDQAYDTIKQTAEPSIFTWNLVTTPVKIPGFKATSHLIIDLDSTYSTVLAGVENVLYGTDSTEARLPSILELLDIFEQGSVVRIVDHGDGSWSAIGPDAYVHMIDANSFEIISPTAVYLDDHTYRISSW